MFLKERWHRFGWEDLREVENALVDGVGTQSRDLSSEKFVGNDVLFRQVSPASIHCFSSLRLTCHLLTQILLPRAQRGSVGHLVAHRVASYLELQRS